MATKASFPVRLQKAVQTCHRHVEPMLKKRRRIIEKRAAGWYDTENIVTARPINIVWQYYMIMLAFLAARSGKSVVIPRANSGLSGEAYNLTMAMNHLKEEIKFLRTLRYCVDSSFSYMGMAKVGMCEAYTIKIGGETFQAGQPYCLPVDPDDIVFDVAARRTEDVSFIGNRYRVPLQYVAESGLFKNYDKLKAASPLYGAETSPESAVKKNLKDEDYYDLKEHVILYDLYLPDESVMVTIAESGHGEKILRTVTEFPETGPFELLSYYEFLGSIVPIPPVYPLLDLDEQLNAVARRMKRQMDREKTILAYEGIAEADAKRIVGSSDGEAVHVESVDSIKEIKMGGVSTDTIQLASYLRANVSEQAGNLDSLGGIRSEADTLGQEQMISSKSQGPVLDMLRAVHTFCTNVDKKLAWYLMSDPLISIPMTKRAPGGINIDTVYSNYDKEGDYLDYNFAIQQYSTLGMSPEAAYQKLLQVVNQVVLPVVQIAASQGQVLDARKLVETASRFIDLPELAEIFTNSASQKVDIGPYQPMQGQTKPKSGQPDGRISAGGYSEVANLNQQQSREGVA